MIYLDNNATTPLDPRVLEAMMPYFTEKFGNAASNHAFGVEVNQAVKKAREQVSDLIGCETSEVIFTSGATEAINLALKGATETYGHERNHIVTVATEHPAVLDTCKYLESKGTEVTYLPVQRDGLLDLAAVESAIRQDTLLVCVMLVNNETGVIQPVKEIAALAHAKGAFFMCDATQAVGKMPVDVNALDIDLMAFSGHKFYGPKGIGALYVRSRRPNKVKLGALIHGGGHEQGLRSGTLNVPGIVGLGEACVLAKKEMGANAQRIVVLRDHLETELLKIENSFVNGSREHRLYNVSNICFEGVDADAIMMGLKDIMVSNGSACSSTKVEPSHVLVAMGLSERQAYGSLRVSLGRETSEEDIVYIVSRINPVVSNLKAFSEK